MHRYQGMGAVAAGTARGGGSRVRLGWQLPSEADLTVAGPANLSLDHLATPSSGALLHERCC